MKILITGGAGFIGSAVIRHIINNSSDEIVNVDKLTYAGNLSSIAPVLPTDRYVFVQADICNAEDIHLIFDNHQPDAVMHLAAESHVDRSIDGPEDFILTNVVGTYNMLEISRKYWQGLKGDKQARFVFHHVSTDEVYGDLEELETPFSESNPYDPSSPYSATKAGSDHLVRAWHRTYGMPVLISNCSNNYGPYQFPEKLIPHMILNALEGKALPVYGDGSQVRDWLYVEDHARALHLIIREGRIGETYNIGGHNEKQNIEVVKKICEVLEDLASENPYSKGFGPGFAGLIEHVKDRPGHDKRYAIDASKIEAELGWKPDESFESGIYKTVAWYLENQDWWRAVLDGSYKLERLGDKVS